MDSLRKKTDTTGVGVAQVETAVVVGTITVSGNATVTVTAAGMTNSPKAVTVAVVEDDTAALMAAKMRTALEADEDVAAFFTVGGTAENLVLTAIQPAANDATMNIAVADDTSTGITEDATSNNTTAGVAEGYAKDLQVATGNGNLDSIRVHNKGASTVYLQYFDLAETAAEAAPPHSAPIPLAAGSYYESDSPFDFRAGLYVCASSTAGVKTLIAANDVWITAFWRGDRP